jgi:hypothetical protein
MMMSFRSSWPEAAADLIALLDPLHLLFAGILEQRLVERVRHHLDAVGVGPGVEAQDVAARGVGDGEDERAPPDCAADHGVRIAPGHPTREVLGEEEVDAVVDGHDRRSGAEERPDVVRRMKEVGPEPMELPRNGDVFLEAITRGVVDDGDEVGGEVAKGGFVSGTAEDEVRGLAIESREMAHQISDVRPDTEIPPLPRVDRDLHPA